MRARVDLPPPVVPIFWGLFFLEATFGAYLGVWPLWIERLGAPVAVVGLVLGAGGFVRLLVLAPSATIAEKLGYRRAILLCRGATAIGLISAAFATHWTQLTILIAGAAIGELVFPLMQVLVAAHAGASRVRVFAVVFTVGPSIALIVSPLISGGLVALFGIRAAFLFGAATTLISLIFLARITEPPALPARPDQARSTYRAAFADPGVRLVAILLPAVVFTLAVGVSFIPTFLEDVRGLAPATITTLGAAAAVGSAVFGLLVARIGRLQRKPFYAVAMAVLVTVFGLIIFRASASFALILVAFLCRGGLFSAWAMLSAALGELAPAVHRARAFALCEMAGGLAFSTGPMIAGVLYARRETLSFEIAIALGLLLLPLIVYAQRHGTELRRRALEAEATVPEIAPVPAQ